MVFWSASFYLHYFLRSIFGHLLIIVELIQHENDENISIFTKFVCVKYSFHVFQYNFVFPIDQYLSHTLLAEIQISLETMKFQMFISNLLFSELRS